MTETRATKQALATYTNLLRVTATLQGTLTRQLDSFGLTMTQFQVLAELMRSGPQTQKTICERLLFTGSNMTFIARKLAERGLAAQGKLAGDQRSRVIHLTVEGKKLIANVYPHHAKVVRALMCVLKIREQETLSRLCRKLEIGHPLRFMRELTVVE